jgi:hypothetical protein
MARELFRDDSLTVAILDPQPLDNKKPAAAQEVATDVHD